MKKYPFLLFSLLVTLALLPVLLLRDYTPGNELRYLSIVDEALRNGHFLTFTNQGLPYADKPPLYFWLLMLGKEVLGGHVMVFLLLFSWVPALVVAKVMDGWVSDALPAADRFTGRLLLMSTGLFLGLGVILRMDMLMCMFIVLALRTFYRMLTRQGSERMNAVMFPVYVFLALFSKGPVGVLVPLLATTVFLLVTKRIGTWPRYWGRTTWSVLLSGCALWFVGVYAEGGGAYLSNLLFHQTVDRAVNSFHHDAPFYYYFTSVWYSLAPWSLLLLGVLVAGIKRGLVRTELERFFLTVLVTVFVLLSCISSKIAVYLAPAFPFFVYLPVLWLSHFRWNRALALSIALPAVVFVVSAPVLIFLAGQRGTDFLGQPFLYAAAAVLTLTGGASLYFLYGRKAIHRSLNLLAVGLFVAIFVGGWSLPALNSRLGFASLCREAQTMAQAHGAQGYIAFGISRPESMDVFLQQEVKEVSILSLLTKDYRGSVLLLPARAAAESSTVRRLIQGKESCEVGAYRVVVF